MQPYIGICDFPNGDQSRKSAGLFQELCGTHGVENRKLMIGVMMSFKTMTGEPSRWTTVWPKKEEVAEIFVDHPLAFNTLHYADYDGNTNAADFINAVKWGGPHLHAIQLDMIWPAPIHIAFIKRKFPDLKVVLQVNTTALNQVDNRPVDLVRQVGQYGESLDYILLDKSHGKGVGMEANILLPFAHAIAESLPNISIAVAGGLGMHTLGLVEPLVKEIPNLSIDAQGKLRPSGNALDPIDWSMADAYMSKAIQIFS